ncbi:hypothetical protein FGADI_13237 [Fusarium gaditjirri]|uniref:Uncharacterized protein n=1 Tax=Fusarium gaditjirri TaxID=282569 RepID=A0A8H4WN62_9HYPO|nr:hypothetical protein FGADI_13237 [Fusarium gaditjirri]
MGFLETVRGQKQATTQNPDHPDETIENTNRPGKGGIMSSSTSDDSLDLVDQNEQEVLANSDHVTAGAQIGIRKAEAAALVWPKKTVYITYTWQVYLRVIGFDIHELTPDSILNNVTYYAYSDFQQAPQIATAQILSSIIGGVLKLPIAKVLNIWGRAEGFLMFVTVYLLGMIILASSNGPDSYAAGYVLYYIGYSAVYFIMDVFIADTSGLRNRAFAFAFVSIPFICTAFTGPLAAQSSIRVASWRWAIGTFCIVMTVVLVPLAVVFKFFQRKAEKMGLFFKTRSGRTVTQSNIYYCHEFDIIGAFFLMAAFVLFLLPFSLTIYGRSTYSSATFIAMAIHQHIQTEYKAWFFFRKLGANCLRSNVTNIPALDIEWPDNLIDPVRPVYATLQTEKEILEDIRLCAAAEKAADNALEDVIESRLRKETIEYKKTLKVDIKSIFK